MRSGLYGLPSGVHRNDDAVHEDGQLRLQRHENDDGLRSDVPDVRGLHDAGFDDVSRNVHDVRRDVPNVRAACEPDGQE
jgi:hypothetical protein